MTIKVDGGRIVLNHDVPVFIGATGPLKFSDDLGSKMIDFTAIPAGKEPGTLVFDLPSGQRRPMSAKFFHYRWQENKLVVDKEGLDVNLFRERIKLDPTFGLLWETSLGHYFTANYQQNYFRKRVDVINFLRYHEGKISIDELNEFVIKQ